MKILTNMVLKPKYAGALICASVLLFSNVQAGAGDPDVSMLSTSITVSAPLSAPVTKLVLRVAGPDGVDKYQSEGDSISVDFSGMADGSYNYESWSIAENNGDRYQTGKSRGRFRVSGGTIFVESIAKEEKETSMTMPQSSIFSEMLSSAVDFIIPTANAQNVTVDSTTPLVIFDETDDGDAFDWFLRGDNVNGFDIRDDTLDSGAPNLTTVFRIEPLGGATPAPTTAVTENSIVIEDTGNISFADGSMYLSRAAGKLGLGTTAPDTGIHVLGSGKSQLIKLENTTESTWTMGQVDLLGTSAADGDFRISITDNGNTGPDGIMMAIADETGLATFPNGVESSSQVRVSEMSGADGSVQTLFNLINNGPPAFRFFDSVSGQTWQFRGAQSGSFFIDDPATGTTELEIQSGGTLRVGGAVVQTSSRAKKHDFTSVNANEILKKVVDLDISAWSYKSDPRASRHIGPVSEDFYAAFKLGSDATGISSVDTAGVTFASIQALNAKIASQEEMISGLQARIGELEGTNQRIASLEATLNKLVGEQQLKSLASYY